MRPTVAAILAASLAITLLGAAAAAGQSPQPGESYALSQDGTWSKPFAFKGCRMRVQWGTATAKLRFYKRTMRRCRAKDSMITGPGPLELLTDTSGGIPVATTGHRRKGTRKDRCGRYHEWRVRSDLPDQRSTAVRVTVNARTSSFTINLSAQGHKRVHRVRC